ASWRSAKPLDMPFTDPIRSDPTLESTVRWQRALWRAVHAEGGVLESMPPPAGGKWVTLDSLVFDDTLFAGLGKMKPPTVHVFGVSYVARLFQHLFGRLGRVCTLRVYTLNPCAEYWEDVETHRELFNRLGRQRRSRPHREKDARSRKVWSGTGETDDTDPFGLSRLDDMPALQYWGRPGREHLRLLGELTDCDFESAFSDPMSEGGGLLRRLQLDVLLRNEEPFAEGGKPQPYGTADESIRLIAAPSVRREVEWVADEIWRLVKEDSGPAPLRFSEIAVIVNGSQREAYLPQIEAVFAACHDLPSSVSDLPGSAGSRLVEAMGLLLKLPFGRFSRAEMLAVMGHPAVAGGFDELTIEEMADRAEALGIVFGADHSDHQGTYIEEDVYNWDQGLRRLALGAFMTGEKSGDERIFESPEGRWIVEETLGSSEPSAARFALLARSLIADARFVRSRRMRLSNWARFYSAQIDAYLHVESSSDASDRLRLLRALSRLEEMDQGLEVSGRVAAELARRAVESLGGGRGQYLAEGVVVSSFLPMRAIPFRVVFVLGLGEGLFPASGRRDALDLRAARRRAGDVDPSERDRYMFLETLLCTREKLYLSYVRRDEQTGDPLQPSAVVQELLHMLETGYLGSAGSAALRVEPPLRRFDEPSVKDGSSFIDEAHVEARVEEISEGLGLGAGGAGLPPLPAVGKLQALRDALDPERGSKLSTMIGLPSDPPEASAVEAVSGLSEGSRAGSVEAPIALSLSALRTFLCSPMQGWARAMLGMEGEEEDAVDREEEDFEMGRLEESGLLRAVFSEAAMTGAAPSQVYESKAERLKLKGGLPAGVLGRMIRGIHQDVLDAWTSAVARIVGGEEEIDSREALSAMKRARLGAAGTGEGAEIVLDPLVLEVPVSRPGSPDRVVPVHLSGVTDALLDDGAVSVSFQATKPGGKTGGRIFRYLMGGVVGHAALSAAGVAGDGERRLMAVLARDPGEIRLCEIAVRSLAPDQARAWLTDLVADLLVGVHAYLLPCEAVFSEMQERLPSGTDGGRGRRNGERSVSLEPDGQALAACIEEMAANDRAGFSCLWGPVPSPREYPPPSPRDAAAMVVRRFGPFFENVVGMEGF
ncbi:MAG: exodeoxyribonuclease V subunit gamma, partial [Myxococcota bacterium]